MARLQGISGGLSGKTGSYTFRQSRGQTIVSQYQPIVKNPNTKGQQNQRAKFKLMSQLAAIMAPSFGTMGVTKRPGKQAPTQRNAFVQLNMPLVEVDSSADNEVVAKIPMEELKLTSSNRYYGTLAATGLQGGSIAVTIDNVDKSVKDGRIALVGYGTMGVTKLAQIVEIVDAPAEEGSIEYTFSGLEPGDYTVLSFGLIPTATTSTTASLDNIHTPADEDFISAVALDAMVRAGQMVETTTLGANVKIVNA